MQSGGGDSECVFITTGPIIKLCAGVGPVRNPVLQHRVAPCFPWDAGHTGGAAARLHCESAPGFPALHGHPQDVGVDKTCEGHQ